MAASQQTLAAQVEQRFGDMIESCSIGASDVTVRVPHKRLYELCLALRDEPEFSFGMLIDLCGIDYLGYGEGALREGQRFAVAYHLLSIANNRRICIKTFLDDEQPRVDSVIGIWASANWYEREAFDLYGILFDGHPDLRRLLTDYGFIGHPFRKDFPLSGNVEMRYDPERQRVVYEPVSIEPRILVPRVIRHDHRYLVEPEEQEEATRG